jgi:hypothetical protein
MECLRAVADGLGYTPDWAWSWDNYKRMILALTQAYDVAAQRGEAGRRQIEFVLRQVVDRHLDAVAGEFLLPDGDGACPRRDPDVAQRSRPAAAGRRGAELLPAPGRLDGVGGGDVAAQRGEAGRRQIEFVLRQVVDPGCGATFTPCCGRAAWR